MAALQGEKKRLEEIKEKIESFQKDCWHPYFKNAMLEERKMWKQMTELNDTLKIVIKFYK